MQILIDKSKLGGGTDEYHFILSKKKKKKWKALGHFISSS